MLTSSKTLCRNLQAAEFPHDILSQHPELDRTQTTSVSIAPVGLTCWIINSRDGVYTTTAFMEAQITLTSINVE